MKVILCFILLCSALLVRGQEIDTLVAKQFLKSNLPALVSLNKEKILAQTHYPLVVGDKKLTKEQFKLILDKVFNADLRKELGTKGIHDIDAWEMLNDTSPTYMLVCYEGLEEQYEAVVFCFLQYNGQWQLNKIDYHKRGEE